MQMSHKLPHGPAPDSWKLELLYWGVIGLIVLLNAVMMWRIATATV
jgi:hypothetical protein